MNKSTLGLPSVRSMKERGPDIELPSCAQWPLNVRPEAYYLGAHRPRDQSRDQVDASNTGDSLAELLDQVLADFDAGDPWRSCSTA